MRSQRLIRAGRVMETRGTTTMTKHKLKKHVVKRVHATRYTLPVTPYIEYKLSFFYLVGLKENWIGNLRHKMFRPF